MGVLQRSVVLCSVAAFIVVSCASTDIAIEGPASPNQPESVESPADNLDEATTTTTIIVADDATSDAEESVSSSDRVADRSTASGGAGQASISVVPAPPAVDDEAPRLRRDGLGAFNFGAAFDVVAAALVERLGPPVRDDVWEFSQVSDGEFIDVAGDHRFAYPYGRATCFVNGLCMTAGGDEVTALRFVGWTQWEGIDGFVTDRGVGVGSRWSEHESDLTIDSDGCAMYGSGTSRGIDIEVISTGGEFGSGLGASNAPPAMSDIVVIGLSAGELREFVHPSC